MKEIEGGDIILQMAKELTGREFLGAVALGVGGLVLSGCTGVPVTEAVPSSTPKPTNTETKVPPTSTGIPTATPTPTPTPTEIPTPTEVPMYTGEFPDTSEYYRRMGALEQHFLEFTEVRTLEDMKLLQLFFGAPLSLVQVSNDPDTGITQFVWGFSVRGNDYRFRTYALPYCEFKMADIDHYVPGGGDLVGNPTIGQYRNPVFLAVQEPLSEAWIEFTGGYFPACSDVMGDLLPQDKDRLGQFFFNGNTEGFEIDEKGILDLRRVLITTNVLVANE